jgi:predicted ArsR family transcriptional regulator
MSEEAFSALLESNLAAEYLRSQLLLLSAKRPLSVKEMASELKIAPRQVLPHVVALEQAGLMSMVGIERQSPKYRGKP